MTVLAEQTIRPQTKKNPRELVPAWAWNLLVEDFRGKHHTSHAYTDRVVGQCLVFLYAAGRIQRKARHNPGDYVRIVPTPPVDEAWHQALQRTEVYLPLSLSFAGSMLHHRPVMDDDIRSGAALERTIPILEHTGLLVDPEFWADEAAASCCPPECAVPGLSEARAAFGLPQEGPPAISF